MRRAIRPAGAVVVTLAVAGCGAGGEPATTGLATPGAVGAAPGGPRSTGALPPATAPEPRRSGDPTTPQGPTVTDAGRSVPCPADREGSGTFDARELEGRTLRDAEAVAKERGCSVRVARRDGRDLALTEDLSPSRINVAVTKGRVTRVLGVN